MCHKKMLVPSGNTDLDVYLQMVISTSALQFHSHPIPVRIGTMKINPIQLGLDISDYKRGGRGARAARPGHRKISAAAMPIYWLVPFPNALVNSVRLRMDFF